jgi:hypothetical protein
MLTANPYLAGEFGGRDPLGDAAEDQEDLGRAEMRPLPVCSREHIEDTSTSRAAVVDDRGAGATAMDVEPIPGGTTRAREPVRVEQVEELPAATLLVDQVEEREVHGVGSEGIIIDDQNGQESRHLPGWQGPTTESVT